MQILYEDNHLIAANKPAGWLVQGDRTGDKPLSDFVKYYIKTRYNKPGDVFLGTIHRIDRPVSGVVIFARTSKALTRMNKLFQERAIQKTYLAITKHRPNPLNGKIEHYLLKNKEKNKTFAYNKIGKKTQKAKKASLQYEMIAGLNNHHLLEVHPETGRPHQIRVQLSMINCPIVGDIKYGYPTPNDDASIHLHSWKLSFIHPVKNIPVTITAEPPEQVLWNMFTNFY